ncbi:reverse transcriptase [Senna tora]|uniref:Reverse transcriptase n=1 Tax=Senna tora TaxID=362788 RepID=A0A834XCN7_9FABA|nr:reverse transcriptase [Senna tora]
MGFWEDRWIPTLSGNKLNDVNGDVNLKVSYVISNGSWDMSKLVGLVSQEELNAILAIPLRSGRACIEALATNEALVKTRCGIPIVCEYVCANAPEKIEHLLVLCDWAKLAWFCYPLKAFVFLMWGLVVVFRGAKADPFLAVDKVDDSWVAPGTDMLKCNVDRTFDSGFAFGGERVVFESDCAVLVDAVAGLKGAKTSRPSSCRLVSEEGVKRVVTKDWVFNPPPSLASILTFDVTRSGSNIGDRSSNSCFSAGCAVGCACFREGVG